MKIILSSLLALATTSVHANTNDIQTDAASGTAILTAWSMDDPTTSFSGNSVSMVYSSTSTETFSSNMHINEAFFGPDCSTNQILAGSGIGAADDVSKIPQATWDGVDNAIKLDFTIVPEILNAGTSDYYTDDGNGVGTLQFCVRTSLGYGGEDNRDKTLAEQIQAGFKEVNFREAIFTITYDLTAGFSQISASVNPLERDSQTESVDGRYQLTAWICDTTTTETVTVAGITRSFPVVKSGGFNQGALIPICIRPQNAAYGENVVMSHVKELKWVRDTTEQPAIVPSATPGQPGSESDNRLSYHAGCSGADFCLVETILFADFYLTTGQVTAEGSAQVMFDTTRRRLAAPRKKNRLLQDEDIGSAFELDVPVNAGNIGPAALKTAGGASLGLATLTSAVALMSAILMA